MDLVLIAPGNHKGIFQELAKADYPALEPPVWAGLIANHVRTQGRRVTIIDQCALGLSPQEVAKKVEELNPRLVGVVVYGHQPSASTQCMTMAYKVIAKVKEHSPEIQQILVGGHVSALPKQSLYEANGLNLKTPKDMNAKSPSDDTTESDTKLPQRWSGTFVCQGEGPLTIQKLLEVSRFDDSSQLKKVPGLWFFDDEGSACFSGPAPTISQENLPVELPGVSWDLLPMEQYRAHNWHAFSNNHERRPYASLYTSLGCPFRCSFCCINAPFGRPSIRYWDPKFVIKELDTLANEYGVVNLKFVDEMFVLHEKHVTELCDLIVKRGHRFNIWAYARVDTVKPKILEKLKSAGFNWLVLGIESGSKHVRNGVKKGRFGIEDIRQSVQMVRDHGINVHGNYIFGLPDDDRESMQETLDLAIDLNTEFANFYSAMAYPGSQLYTQAKEQGLALPQTWEDYSQHGYGTLPLPTDHLSAGQVLTFRDEAWQKYFTGSQFQSLLGEKFGSEALDHIQGLTKYTLKRKFAEPL